MFCCSWYILLFSVSNLKWEGMPRMPLARIIDLIRSRFEDSVVSSCILCLCVCVCVGKDVRR